MIEIEGKKRIRLVRAVASAIFFISCAVHYDLKLPDKLLQQKINIIDRAAKSNGAAFPKQKILIYITTHMSLLHIWYLQACWPDALDHSSLLRNADVMVHMTTPEEFQGVVAAEPLVDLLRGTFAGQNITVHVRKHVAGRDTMVGIEHEKKQNGAMAALIDAAKNKWFHGYDWVIRLNPDVIVRNDTFILETIQDPSVTALLVDCYHDPKHLVTNPDEYSKIHTDFFAIKPSALPHDAFLVPKTKNAEKSFTEDIRDSILKVGGHRFIPGAEPLTPGFCKLGFGRTLDMLGDTPITHWEPQGVPDSLICPIPF